MRRTWKVSLVAAVLSLASARLAVAQDTAGEAPRRLVLNQGQIGVNGTLQLNLSTSAIGKPFSIAPDILYGVTQQLTVGLVTSQQLANGFIGGLGNGLCVTGAKNGCGKVFNALGVNAWFALMEGGPLQLAIDGGLYFNSFDPMFMGLKVGANARYTNGPIVVQFDPNIFFGFTKRDMGNKEALALPVTISFWATPAFAAGLQSGIEAPLSGFGDAWSLPLSILLSYMINPNFGVVGSFSFLRLAGGAPGAGADARAVNLGVMWRN